MKKYREEFRGKNVYISGGSSGIGLSAARLFASLGANVFIFSRDAARVKAALAEIATRAPDGGQRFDGASLDVGDWTAVREKLSAAAENFGPPYALINSAGLGGAFHFEELSFERFDATMKINLYGVRNTSAALVPFMKKGGGYLVNVSSIGGFIGIFGYTGYGASKFGVIGFSESLRSELKPHGITVSALCPPDVDTPMMHQEHDKKPAETRAISDGGGLMSAERVAEEMLRGMVAGKFIIIPGAKGKFFYLLNRLLPGLREWALDRTVARVQRAEGNDEPR